MDYKQQSELGITVCEGLCELHRSMKCILGTMGLVLSYIFDIGGNKFRLIAAAHFNVQKLYVRHIFTHKEYDKWRP